MSYKSENWKESLEQVRSHVQLKEGSIEKSAEQIIDEEIEAELRLFETEVIEEDILLEASAGAISSLSVFPTLPVTYTGVPFAIEAPEVFLTFKCVDSAESAEAAATLPNVRFPAPSVTIACPTDPSLSGKV